jgi:BMFP domain-containing protein YqiC
LRRRRTIAIVISDSKQALDRRRHLLEIDLPASRTELAEQNRRALEALMVQTTNRFFDEVARLMNDAAGVAQGVRREFETLFRTQAERWLRDLDLVKRDEFEAVKDMARIAREENEALKARVATLEATLGTKSAVSAAPSAPGINPDDPSLN